MNSVEYQLRLNQNDDWHMERPHFHDSYEVLLSLSDAGQLFIENKVYPLQRGALCLLDGSKLHRTDASGHYERYVLYVPPRTFSDLSTPQSDLIARTRDVSTCVVLDEPEIARVVELFDALAKRRNTTAFGDDLRCTVALLALLLKVFSLLELHRESESVSSRDFQRISPILAYIGEHLAEPLTLDHISEQFYISKHHLCHIFKSATGFSVMEYIIYSRILNARSFLRAGCGVQEAGERAGFASNAHFIRTFGELTGISPGKYAKTHLASDRLSV